MKKISVCLLGIVIISTLLGCQKIKDKVEAMEHPEYEKIEDASGILDKILEHIAKITPEFSFEAGELLDFELGVPRFERVPISEIKHFNEEDVVNGFIVRPVVDVDNPRLLIVVEAVDKEASNRLDKAMLKLHSDQSAKFFDDGIWTKYLVNNNETVRQGNFLLYVTWDNAEKIAKIFERHVR